MVGPRVVLAQLAGEGGVAELSTRLTHAGEVESGGALPGLGGGGCGDGAGDGSRADEHIDEPHGVWITAKTYDEGWGRTDRLLDPGLEVVVLHLL